ncbi:tRNA(Met) cytidine acetyltransferase TmcA [Natrialba sp. SSL1]|uniref:tRNA(Met) cytidine acetyltransferase TmcA n=1 Tax=Natrialba sp. SSL1 TaxID=1869245 RepID=UPI0008F90EE6|nr:tRNA(Met) cytidine acetyltransferase TmcA [Natrialba sp. SSL1]OIB59309.1 tRNA(Met) cytidine acetyltransferase [Natrialba sp. SSL1]
MNVGSLATDLYREAQDTTERRALVLSGDRERGYACLESILSTLPVAITDTTLVGPDDRLRCEQLSQVHTAELLGTTRQLLVLDAHADLQPNALGRIVGTIDGGGLLIVLAPELEYWPDQITTFDESLAVPPFATADVTGRFRSRLIETLREHRGIGIVEFDGTDSTGAPDDPTELVAHEITDTGLTHPAPVWQPADDGGRSNNSGTDNGNRSTTPSDAAFPHAAYDACLTGDQREALTTFEALSDSEQAVVLEADRGRGKSSAAGLAAGGFALDGNSVLVTAPAFRNTTELFARAGELVTSCDSDADVRTDQQGTPREITTSAGGRVWFRDPDEAVSELGSADIVIVDEAAALPVSRLESFLAADRVAFTTTVHGYEGAGRGFSVRFRDRLTDSAHEVSDYTLSEPIRYAAGDPLEVWAFRALLLDARPPVTSLVADATPESVDYRALEPDDLLADDQLLREAFGLLVLAHYRTEPNDLARLLDAPNLEARALVQDGHVVSVALLAREGNLDADTRAMMYDGGRVRGNMLPDVLTSQLRDESASKPAGIRIVRIATHHEVRARGLGSRLLESIRDEFAPTVDWLGTGFGATPGLLEFWRANGFRAVHVSTTRNNASGEYSALMLAPTSEAGQELHERHAAWFARRFAALCSDALADLDPDVARAILRATASEAAPPLTLGEHDWRVVAGAAYGPGLFDVDPGPFRELVIRYFLEEPASVALSAREERLLVLRALQGREWSAVADRLEYPSAGQCMRALGEAFQPLVDEYGDEVAMDVRDRFADG